MKTQREKVIAFFSGVLLSSMILALLTFYVIKISYKANPVIRSGHSAELVEAVHSALILSLLPAPPKRTVRYMGATQFNQLPRGYYQYLTSSWEIIAKDKNDKEQRIILSLSSDQQRGTPIYIRHIGEVNFTITIDDKIYEQQGENIVIDVGYGEISIRESLNIIFKNFKNSQYELDHLPEVISD